MLREWTFGQDEIHQTDMLSNRMMKVFALLQVGNRTGWACLLPAAPLWLGWVTLFHDLCDSIIRNSLAFSQLPKPGY